MLKEIKKPYVIYMAEIIYYYISTIKNRELNIDTKEAINKFIDTDEFNGLSSGKFHEKWFNELKRIITKIKILEKIYQKRLLSF